MGEATRLPITVYKNLSWHKEFEERNQKRKMESRKIDQILREKYPKKVEANRKYERERKQKQREKLRKKKEENAKKPEEVKQIVRNKRVTSGAWNIHIEDCCP